MHFRLGRWNASETVLMRSYTIEHPTWNRIFCKAIIWLLWRASSSLDGIVYLFFLFSADIHELDFYNKISMPVPVTRALLPTLLRFQKYAF